MTSARQRVAEFWDAHTNEWLDGADSMSDPLPKWFEAYQGVGPGEVTRHGFPEPFQGDLLGIEHSPRVVVLGLNPGRYEPLFQARNGIFADEIRQTGSYTKWALGFPYLSSTWTDRMGDNRYHKARLRFARNWLDDPSAEHRDLLIFECFPWHSTVITAPLRPAPEIIDEFVWRPIAEFGGIREVFAFRRSWDHIAQALDLRLTGKWGRGGADYGSAKCVRAVRTYALPSGQSLVIEWHQGSAGPPSPSETALLRTALQGAGSHGPGVSA
ncbi:hypothetical protein [Plantactinospora sp. BB1]|uniref:anti-phage DNA glycosylase Brig1 n=1 Tax=Plantactinospora sp. BB1 TaxID=2071627 RepID=UPI00131F14FE|nr:hypothetical protein [Plantactinospora sp. BB1]